MKLLSHFVFPSSWSDEPRAVRDMASRSASYFPLMSYIDYFCTFALDLKDLSTYCTPRGTVEVFIGQLSRTCSLFRCPDPTNRRHWPEFNLRTGQTPFPTRRRQLSGTVAVGDLTSPHIIITVRTHFWARARRGVS